MTPVLFDTRSGPNYYSALMSPHLPELLDPRRWAELGKRGSGRAARTRFTRLAGLIGGGAPQVDFEMEFALDDRGRVIVAGRARAELLLQCQRCLGLMPYSVDVRFRLAAVESPSEAERLPDELEPLLITDGQLSTLDVVEDELLLSLPLVARHAPEQCASRQESTVDIGDEDAPSSPFAVLEVLKRRGGSNT